MRQLRISITGLVLVLICIGVVMIYSSSGVYSLLELNDRTYFLKRHLIFLCLGFLLTAGVMSVDYRELQKYAKPFLIFAVLLLAVVLIPWIGKASHGARRWIPLGPFNFQPAELTKVAMIVYVADFLSRKQNKIRDLKQGFLPIVLILGFVCLLIIKQPDLGSCVLITLIVMTMMFVAGTRLSHIGALFLLALPVAYLAIFRVPYRLARIKSFLNPFEDSLGAGFQLTQSKIALGSGGIFGVGLGKSVQKLFYLPAAHTDFILSIAGEELGFIGAFSIIVLFGLLILQMARIAKRTNEPFGYFLGIGIMMMIGSQAVINIGVSIGSLPTKGLPLPFISYGGSALIMNMMAIGLLLNISRVEDL